MYKFLNALENSKNDILRTSHKKSTLAENSLNLQLISGISLVVNDIYIHYTQLSFKDTAGITILQCEIQVEKPVYVVLIY